MGVGERWGRGTFAPHRRLLRCVPADQDTTLGQRGAGRTQLPAPVPGPRACEPPLKPTCSCSRPTYSATRILVGSRLVGSRIDGTTGVPPLHPLLEWAATPPSGPRGRTECLTKYIIPLSLY